MSGFDTNSLLRVLLQTGGTAAGGILGGPAGAGLGSTVGRGAGQALFADDQKHGQAILPSGGPSPNSSAFNLLQGIQQQMQSEEQRRQQALMQLLQQALQPQAVQMESRVG